MFLSDDSRVELRFDPSVSLARGDAFEIVRSTFVTARDPIGDLLVNPVRPDGLLLVPEIDEGVGTAALLARAKRETRATWTGGAGTFADPSRWSFDAPLPAAASGVPSNDAFSLFGVDLDSDPAVADDVTLASGATVDRLSIGAGDRLSVVAGGNLALDGSSARAGSRAIHNDGVLALGTGAVLQGAVEIDVTGTGELQLAGGRIETPSGNFPADALRNGAGHTIVGAGTIDGPRVANAGIVRAQGGTLELTSSVSNEGLVDVAAGSRFTGSVIENESTGEVTVGPGGRLSLRVLSNEGIVRVGGAGAVLDLTDTFRAQTNAGEIVLDDGALGVVAGGLTQDDADARVRVGRGASLFLQGVFQPPEGLFEGSAGTLELDDGTVHGEVMLSGDGTIVGTGTVGRLETTIDGGGVVSPGLPGVGGGVGTLESLARVVLRAGSVYRADVTASGNDSLRAPTLSVSSAANVEVALDPGLAIARGDAFELARATTVFASSPGELIGGGPVGADLFLVGDTLVDGADELLVARVKERAAATWLGGAGSFHDASGWGLDRAGAPAVPNENDEFLVTASIASGAVALDADARVESLAIGAPASLTVGGGSELSVASMRRTGAGRIDVDGELVIGTPAGGAIRVDGPVALGGAGTTVLDDGRVAGFGTLEIEAGHRFGGAGAVEVDLVNRGLLQAAPGRRLDFEGVENLGAFEATDGRTSGWTGCSVPARSASPVPERSWRRRRESSRWPARRERSSTARSSSATTATKVGSRSVTPRCGRIGASSSRRPGAGRPCSGRAAASMRDGSRSRPVRP